MHRLLEVGITVTTAQFWILRATVTASYVRADFEFLNSITLFTIKRADDRYLFRFVLKFPGVEKEIGVTPAISVTYENWSSNIDAWDFDRWDLQTSVEVLALSF